MDPKFYAQYENGHLSNSINDLEAAAKWLEYYRSRHPDKQISIVDEDGYIVSGQELWGRSH